MYYAILNLPHFNFDESDIVKRKQTIDSYWWPDKVPKRVKLVDGREVDHIRYQRWSFNDDLVRDFIMTNIPEMPCDFGDLGYQIVSNDRSDPIGARMSPHLDGFRGNYVLQYVIDTGGDNIATTWWQAPGQDIYRQQITTTQFFFVNDNYKFLDSVILQKHSWALIRTDVLHSVDHVTADRKLITVGFRADQDFLETIAKKYSTLL